MEPLVLKTNALTKKYKNQIAVDNISITIEKGDIFGLIGLNGAGKTTLMRLITALTFADSGEMEILGERTPQGLMKARERIGCIIETPAFYKNLTAIENLEYYRIQRGIPEKKLVFDVLKLVELEDNDKKKYKNFSLGMKQRLGLALAILNHPDFIILDEPINGLDPVGIVEMREIIKKLNKEGITILISSHILSELSMVATKYGIIHHGKLIKEITDEELKENCKRSILIKVDDSQKAVVILETVLHTLKYKVTGTGELRIYDYLDNPSEVAGALFSKGIKVSGIQEIGDNLEDYFRMLIGEGK
ncbi:MAG: ATP-binding cassette domain-containing protein [Oscillospiraceae bacterium]|nr:ATP-binding cassette domain-containing protein [Oscillospiraceae bacterium]